MKAFTVSRRSAWPSGEHFSGLGRPAGRKAPFQRGCPDCRREMRGLGRGHLGLLFLGLVGFGVFLGAVGFGVFLGVVFFGVVGFGVFFGVVGFGVFFGVVGFGVFR